MNETNDKNCRKIVLDNFKEILKNDKNETLKQEEILEKNEILKRKNLILYYIENCKYMIISEWYDTFGNNSCEVYLKNDEIIKTDVTPKEKCQIRSVFHREIYNEGLNNAHYYFE